jgi:hypothetical protein
MSKEMVRLVPIGSCPICGHNQFVVAESELNIFLTNRDGEIVDSSNCSYKCEGMCINCKTRMPMLATPERFIPLTPLRKLLYENINHNELGLSVDEDVVPNPMEVAK